MALKNSITFDKSATIFVLSAFEYTVNQDGIILDKEGVQAISKYGELLNLDNFAGLYKNKEGNLVLLDDGLLSILDFAEQQAH